MQKRGANNFLKKCKTNYWMFGVFCFFWFIIRSGSRPSRVVYPCQKAAISSSVVLFGFTPFVYLSEIKEFVKKKYGRK